jgi:adenine-specific DNA-methyltransferase
MKPITPIDPESKSADVLAENIFVLKSLFPELITEGIDGVAVNVDVLKSLVGDKTVTDSEEKYGLNWFGKRRSRQLALTPSTGTLRPCPEDSVDWDTTKNLMIEGDNLEVLKLLQKSYAGKVKLIYIDPPYNTGKDFVYPDNFQDNIKNYLELTGQIEGGQRISSNTEASGRFHTDWLNMMYPRLKLARNLLREDGAIFVSIDDSEVSDLCKLCDEVFGEENFIATVVWQKRTAPDMRTNFSNAHDYILVYGKSESSALSLNKLTLTDEQRLKYRNLDNDPRGPWVSSDFTALGIRPNQLYGIQTPSGKTYFPPEGKCWQNLEESFLKQLNEGRFYFGSTGDSVPRRKNYLSETEGRTPWTWWSNQEVGHSQEGKIELNQLYEKSEVFSTPKPVRLLSRMLEIASAQDSVVLDFFSGSGTTGHAVMAQNAIDGGKRRYMLVQLPEPLDPDDKDQKTAADFCDKIKRPRNIAELTKERLRRSGSKVREDNPLFAGDLGFRVFKLDTSNIRAWDPDASNLADTLEQHLEHLKADRTETDILYELLLKLGLDLCVPIAKRELAGKTVYSIGAGVLFACLSTTITREDVEPLAQGIATWRKELAPVGDTSCVFRDSAFADDVAKTNLAAILAQNGLENVRSL